jgi:hypothetical protein
LPPANKTQIPVIYQSAISELPKFLRVVHCHPKYNSDNSIDLEVSLIFNSEELRKYKLSDGLYKVLSRTLYGRGIDIETFWIHLSMWNIYENYFRFENVYSGSYGIEEDSVHLTGETRPIVYYFNNTNHPIVFINTSNHAMGETDINSSFWKSEYVPLDRRCTDHSRE